MHNVENGKVPLRRAASKSEQAIACEAGNDSSNRTGDDSLEEMRKRFELIAQNTSDGIIVIKGWNIGFVSKSYLGQLGYPEEEEIGRTPEGVMDIIHPEDRHVIAEIFSAIERKEKNLTYTYRARKKDGTYIWREDLANFFYDESGNYYQSVVVARDVTFRVETTKQLEEAKSKAEEVARFKSNILNNLSHELRTPMIGILGFSEMLSESLEDGEQKKWANSINKAGTRLIRTLNLLLDYAKWESETVFPPFNKVDIIQLLKNSAELFTLDAGRKGITLTLNSEFSEFILETNPRMLENIFDNLIDNAVKFTFTGGVTVKLEPRQDIIDIKFIDSGLGIAPEYHKLIFEEFRQVSEGIGRSFEGAGLGLTLTKKWCEKIGAKISLESEPDKGSVFTVSLPLNSRDKRE